MRWYRHRFITWNVKEEARKERNRRMNRWLRGESEPSSDTSTEGPDPTSTE